MSRRTRKRLLFVGIILAGAGLLAAGYHLVVLPRRDRIAQAAYERAQQAYEAKDYEGVLDDVGKYLARNREDGEALLITAESHFKVAIAAAAEGREAAARNNYRGARTYALAARAQLGNDPRILELLLAIHEPHREIAEVQEVAAALLGVDPGNEFALAMKVHAARWAGSHEAARAHAEAYADLHPESVAAQALLVECMREDGESIDAIVERATAVSSAYPGRADMAMLLVRAALEQALIHEADLQPALDGLQRIAEATPDDRLVFAEYLQHVDLALCHPALMGRANADRRRQLLEQRTNVTDKLLEDPERRQWAAATSAAWAWGRSGEASAGLAFLDKVADVPDEGADEHLLGWRGVTAQTSQRRAQVTAALETRESALARLWRRTVEAIDARTRGDEAAYKEHLEKGRAVADASGLWLPFFEMESAWSLARANDSAGALRHLRDVVEHSPRLVAPRVALYEQLMNQGRTEDALAEAEFIRRYRGGDFHSVYLWSVAAVAAIEDGRQMAIPPILDWLLPYAQLDADIAERAAGWEACASLAARLYLVQGEDAEAVRIVDQLTRSRGQLDPVLKTALLDSCRRHDLITEAAVLAATDTGSKTPQLLISQAELLARSEGREAAAESLRQAIARSTGDDRLIARLAYVSFLDGRADDAALPAIDSLIEEYSESVVALTHVLATRIIWQDAERVNAALGQLKKLGEERAHYRIFDAARFLTFEYDSRNLVRHVERIKEVLDRDPENVLALRMLAFLFLRDAKGVPSGAIDCFEKAARLGDVESQFYLADLLIEAGRSEDAVRVTEELATLPHPAPSVRRRRADVWQRLGRLERAAEDLASLAGDATPVDVTARAAILVDLGRNQEALDLVEPLVQQGLTDIEAARRAAAVFAVTGDPQRGRELLEGLAADGEAAARLALADYLLFTGHGAEAASIYEQTAVESQRPGVWLKLARCHFLAGQRERACEALARAPDDETIKVARALCDRRYSDPAAGPEILARWMDALSAPQLRSNAMALHGALKSEQEVLDFAESHRTFLLGWLELAAVRQQSGNIAGCIDALRFAGHFAGQDPLPAMLLTGQLIDAGLWSEATIAVRDWRRRAGDSLLIDIFDAVISDSRDEWDRVVALLDPHRDQLIAWAESGSQPAALPMLATALAGAGHPERAHDLLWPLVERQVVPAATYAGIVGRVGQSMSLDDLQTWVGRVASQLPVTDPARAEAEFTLALALESAGKTEDAERHYRLVIDSGVKQVVPSAANNLAELLRRNRRNLGEAVSLAKRAVEAARAFKDSPTTDPQQRDRVWTAFLDTLGHCELTAGQTADAVKAFEQAFAVAPHELHLRAGLIVALEKAGEADRAAQLLDEGMQRVGKPLLDKVEEFRTEYAVKGAAASAIP